jgi:hypothetical protein
MPEQTEVYFRPSGEVVIEKAKTQLVFTDEEAVSLATTILNWMEAKKKAHA